MTVVSQRIAAIAESATLGRRRQGQGAEGRRRARSSASAPASPTSRRPATSSRPPSPACRDPKNHRYTPAAGLPELREAIVDEDRPRHRRASVEPSQVLVTNGGKHAVYERLRRACSTRATRCSCRRRTGPPTRRRSPLAGGVGRRGRSTDETQGFRVTVEQLEAARTANQGAAVRRRPSNPTGAVYTARRDRGHRRAGPWSTASGCVTDEIYEHLIYGDRPRSRRCRPLVPELADHCVIVNGVAKTYAMTGWRVGWLIGPDRRRQGGHQPADRTRPPTSRTWPRRAALAAAERRPARRRRRDAEPPSSRRRHDPRAMLSAIPGVTCLEPEGAFYAYPIGEGPARQASTAAARYTTSPSSPSASSMRPGARSCRARRSACPATCGCRTRSGTTISSRDHPPARALRPGLETSAGASSTTERSRIAHASTCCTPRGRCGTRPCSMLAERDGHPLPDQLV